MNFVKKPVVIEARQLTEENYVEVHDWVHDVDSSSIYGAVIGSIMQEKLLYGGLPIPTLEGVMVAHTGDYVIRGVKGEFYPCKPDIFEMTYEQVKHTMNFGQALEALKQGKKVYRTGWNGVGMWLKLQRPDAHSKMTLPYVYIEYPVNPKHHAYPNGSRVPWLASQTDMLAEDWIIKED